MKSMKAKSKNKRNSTKYGKIKFGSKETSNVITPDLSSLRKPIDISVSRLFQVCKLLENGSDEVKAILAYECDIVYECRVCRSLFRSLVNFISHKRVFCKEKFNIALNKNILIDEDEIYTKGSFIRLHIPEQEVVKENRNNDRILRSQANKVEQKKDLTAIIDMLQKKQRCDNHNLQEMEQNKSHENVNILDSNKANMQYDIDKPDVSIVYQNDSNETKTINFQSMLNQNIGILGPNGQLLEKKDVCEDNNLIPCLANDEYNEFGIDQLSNTNLICSICNAKFSSKKTLTFHMKTLHTSHRTCYPCPCCPSTFVNTWSVYRHLFKIHRMSNEQVRKLRIQIQEKAFRKEIIQSDYTEQDNAVNRSIEIIDLHGSNETREWMNHLETDSELQRCGGCGKKFDRKAALLSHSQHCQKRIAAYNESMSKEKKTAKTSPETQTNSNTLYIVPVMSDSSPDNSELNETSIRVENITSLTDADWNMIGSDQIDVGENIEVVDVTSNVNVSTNEESFNNDTNKDSSPSSKTSDSPEIVYTSEKVAVKNNGNKKRKVIVDNQLKVLNDIIGTTSNDPKDNISSTVNQSTELRNQVDHTTIMENKIATIANLRKLQCLPCKRKFTSMTNLRRHMAIHIGWNRYRCKLCNFKCFVKYDCVAHCNKVHNAQNNRIAITDMVAEIPQNEYTCNEEDIVIDVTNMEENVNELNSISSSSSSSRCKTKNAMTVDKSHKKVGNTSVGNTKTGGNKDVPSSGDEGDNVSITVNNENNNTSKCSKNSECNHTRTLDSDPDLKRMVMEVIFGTPDECPSKKPETTGTSRVTNDTNSDKKSDNNESKTDSETKDWSDNSNSSISPGSLKPQRPIRNRIKPVNKDFIYDLKEAAFRKETIVTKGGSYKTLNKKLLQRLNNGEENSDVPVEQRSSKDAVVPLEQDNNADRLEVKTKSINLKPSVKIPRVPHFMDKDEITILEEKSK